MQQLLNKTNKHSSGLNARAEDYSEANPRLADIAIINKVDAAAPENIELVRRNIQTWNPRADILLARSPALVKEPERIRGKTMLVVEDGPTLTHGGMAYGAGFLAAEKFGAAHIVDPRPFAVGTLKEVFEHYPHIGRVLPAMGCTEEQIKTWPPPSSTPRPTWSSFPPPSTSAAC